MPSALDDWPWLLDLYERTYGPYKPRPLHMMGAGISRLWNRHHGICHYCGQLTVLKSYRDAGRLAATRDHFIPRSKGGGEGDNIVLACYGCNSDKGDKMLDESEAGVLCGDPASVFVHGRGEDHNLSAAHDGLARPVEILE